MPESPTSPKQLSAAQRQAEALRLRSKGMGFQAIADTLGYRYASGAHKAVMTGLQKTLQEPADELRTLEAERLDRMLEGLWDKAKAGGTWQVDRVLGIMERRARLLGLDRPPSGGSDADREVEGFRMGAESMRSLFHEQEAKRQAERQE